MRKLSEIYGLLASNSIGYPIMHSAGSIEVWESQAQERLLYTLKQRGDRLDISDNLGTVADQLSVNNAIQFIKLDIEMDNDNIKPKYRINSKPSMEKNNQDFMVDKDSRPSISMRPEKRETFSFSESLMRKQKALGKTGSSTVKKKRKFDLADLDLEEDE